MNFRFVQGSPKVRSGRVKNHSSTFFFFEKSESTKQNHLLQANIFGLKDLCTSFQKDKYFS